MKNISTMSSQAVSHASLDLRTDLRAGAPKALTSGHLAFTAKPTVWSEVLFAEMINHPDSTLLYQTSAVGW